MGNYATKKDRVKYAEKDLQLHQAIISQTDNPLLKQIMGRFALQIKTFRIVSRDFPAESEVKEAMKEHNEIINSLESRSPALAERTVRRHIRNAAKRLKL